VFVSYAHADADLVAPVMQRIADLGWQVFYDADIQLGQDWNQSLAEAVAACTGFIVMMTSNAIASSHVNHELNFASNKGKSILAVYLEPTQLSVTLSWLLDQNQQLFKWQMNEETYARYLKGFLDNLDVRRTEPLPPGPTLVVDPTGQEGYKRITLALEAAEPNSRILVKPGVYREQLEITKPVELVGEDGARRNTVIQVKRGHVVTFRAATGRVANLTLRQTGSPRKGRWAGIAIEAGAPVVEECVITSSSGPGVVVSGLAAPQVRSNTIQDGRAGIVVAGGQGTRIEANEIIHNWSGMELHSNAQATIQGNQIHGDRGLKLKRRGPGIVVHELSNVTIDNNEINNYRVGIEVRGGGHTLARKNEIRDNGIGIEMRDGGAGTFMANRVFNHRAAGIRVGASSTGTFEGNQVHDGDGNGIDVSGGSGTFKGNSVHDNQQFGVRVAQGRGTFIATELKYNRKGPWSVAKDCAPGVVGLTRNAEETVGR